MKEKILILGASSFAGFSFAQFVIKKKNFKVYGTFSSFKTKKLMNFKKSDQIKLIKLDLLKNPKKLLKIVRLIKPNIVIDFASICLVNESWYNPNDYFKINFNSKIDLIKNLKSLAFIRKYIYVGTPEIFGSSSKKIDEYASNYSPTTPYALSKLSMELLLDSYYKNFKSNIIITRFSNFYGRYQPFHRLIPKTIYKILQKQKFPLQGSGNSLRDFIFEEDTNEALYLVIKKGKIGRKYHFASGKLYEIKDIIKLICRMLKYRYADLVYKVPDRIGKDNTYNLSCLKTKKELNWKNKNNLKEGIVKTIKFYKDILKYD